MNYQHKQWVILVGFTILPTLAMRAQEIPATQPFAGAAQKLELNLTPAEWKSADVVKQKPIAIDQGQLVQEWVIDVPARQEIIVLNGQRLRTGRLTVAGNVAFPMSPSTLQPAAEPDLREDLDLQPLSQIAQRLMTARLRLLRAQSSYGPQHASVLAAEKVQQEIQAYYDEATSILPVKVKAELIDTELKNLLAAITRTQVARTEAEPRFGAGHPTLTSLRKEEESLHTLYQSLSARKNEDNVSRSTP